MLKVSNYIILSDFARRQTPESRFSHYTCSESDLVARVEAGFSQAAQGYRDGVLVVPLTDVSGFYSSTVSLKGGERFTGVYAPRKPGEPPRKQIGVVGGQKIPAARVDVILYASWVLAENNENTPVPSGVRVDYEIVSINAAPTLEPEPMTVGTLLANHFHVDGSNDGGTSTGMTDSQLVEALRVSYNYWKDRAMVADG